MKKRNIAATLFLLTLPAAAAGCGDDIAASADEGMGEEMGTVTLSLASVPTDAACLRIIVTGPRTIAKTFSLPGTAAPTFSIERVPAGVVQVDAQAFASACNATASAVPNYVADAPAFVRIAPPAAASVALHLVHNGRLSVSVDFETQPWISTSLAPVDVAVVGDAPYGADADCRLPAVHRRHEHATPPVAEIVHLGDIKNGSSRCDTSLLPVRIRQRQCLRPAVRLHAR